MTDKQARIAQMESSRIVGGRAQTQALLRAPIHSTTEFTSSGDVLGIHEPGSKTYGGLQATAVSGRADDSATCPDVTRFSSPSGEPEGRRALRPAPGCAAAFNLPPRSMRLSFGASSTTAACDITTPRVAAALSSEIPEAPLWVRQAVAAVGSASAAAADHFNVPGPSLATGKASEAANTGGDHEAVTPLSNGSVETSAPFTSSLARADVYLDRPRTGTAPGSSGPERDVFGAPIFIGCDLGSGDIAIDAVCIRKNAKTFFVAAASVIAETSSSNIQHL